MDQPRIERMLRLMRYMSGNINYSVEELAEKLDMSERTIYRYIDTFRGAGGHCAVNGSKKVVKSSNANASERTQRHFREVRSGIEPL